MHGWRGGWVEEWIGMNVFSVRIRDDWMNATFVGLGERARGCPCFAMAKISKLLEFFCLEE